MNGISLCAACQHRGLGFCGAVLETPPTDPRPGVEKHWPRHQLVRAGENVLARNQVSEDIFVLCIGWAFRFFQLANGRRQILRFLLPGDLFSAASVFEQRYHFSVKALTEIQVGRFGRAGVQARLAANPGIVAALARSCAAETNDADELLAALGQRSAEERIAYLFLHLMKRISALNVIREQRYRLPLRQQHIADAAGLTAVHVSRVLGHFRDRGVVELSEGVLQVRDLSELERIGSLN